MRSIPPTSASALRMQVTQATTLSDKDRLTLYALALIADKLERIAEKG